MAMAALALLKLDLGYTDDSITKEQEDYLLHKLDAARSYIAETSIALDEADPAHLDLLVMYAAYLYRRRDSNEPMPRALRWALNDAMTGSAARRASP